MTGGKLKKEVCGCCHKNINIGQSISECKNCAIAIHTKCFKKSKFQTINNTYYCKLCYPQISRRYNPFKQHACATPNSLDDDNDDRFYNDNFYETVDCLLQASQILENCEPHTTAYVNSQIGPETDFTTFFYNLDGNNTNFDYLATELSLSKIKFSVIGLAETNTDPSEQ